MLNNLSALILAYLLGAIPFGIIVARVCGVDILSKGSGNSGATNVFRALGPFPGALVFFADMLKGFLACTIASSLSGGNPLLIAGAALLAILGHNYSIYIKGKGGKGAATGVGVLLFISWPITICLILLVVIVVWLTRYVSLATLIISLLTPLVFIVTQQPTPYVGLSLLVCFFIWLKHIPNVKRLVNGTENKIGTKAQEEKSL